LREGLLVWMLKIVVLSLRTSDTSDGGHAGSIDFKFVRFVDFTKNGGILCKVFIKNIIIASIIFLGTERQLYLFLIFV
jgi:hypothetical protein